MFSWAGPFLKGSGKEEDGFPWVFSTFDLDRDEERIDPDGWDLKHYQKNPVILWAHDSRIPAIGYARDTGVQNRKLEAGLFLTIGKWIPLAGGSDSGWQLV